MFGGHVRQCQAFFLTQYQRVTPEGTQGLYMLLGIHTGVAPE